MKRKFNNSQREILVGITSSFIVSIVFILIKNEDNLINIVPVTLNVFLMALILFALLQLKRSLVMFDNRLLFSLNEIEKVEQSLEEQFFRILDANQFKLLRNENTKKTVYNYFEQDFKYVRGQNFINVFSNQIKEVKKELLTINDHPFKPFYELISKSINIHADIHNISVVAYPDEYYSRNDISNRIKSIQDEKAETYILPSEEIDFSMLIFDQKYALLYIKPKYSKCCNYSEGFFITNKRSVDYLRKIYYELLLKSKKFHKDIKEDALSILKGALEQCVN